jgi:hypothetical protein
MQDPQIKIRGVVTSDGIQLLNGIMPMDVLTS